jgi:hypothetical protein
MNGRTFYLGGSAVLCILVMVAPPAMFLFPKVVTIVIALITCVALILNLVNGRFWSGDIATVGAWLLAICRSIAIAQSDLSLISMFLWLLWALGVTLMVTRGNPAGE